MTHMLPQPDHVGSAVIRYVSLGLPGFGSFEWDEPRGFGLAGGLAGVWGYRTADRYARPKRCPQSGQINEIRPLPQAALLRENRISTAQAASSGTIY